MRLLKNVFDNYDEMRREQKGKTSKAVGTPYPSIKSIMLEIPNLIRWKLKTLNRERDFKVVGSIGQGAVSEIPWVCIFNRRITESAQKGYYVVLLFSSDMKSCVLSLNQAVTEYKEKYPSKVAMLRMRHTADLAKNFINISSPAFKGAISLKANKHLGIGYETGAIASFHYDESDLPSEATFLSDFESLLNAYDDLFMVCGDALSALNSITEDQYQQHSLELAEKGSKTGKTVTLSDSGGVPIPPKRKISGRYTYARDERFAAEAIRKAEFKCECDHNHKTFKSHVNDRDYVEAHHLIPISNQEKFNFSIDITENIVSLCPTCHRQLHHGVPIDKHPLLQKLFLERENALKSREIVVSIEELFGFYRKEDSLLD